MQDDELEGARRRVDELEKLMLDGGEAAIRELRGAHARARFQVAQLE